MNNGWLIFGILLVVLLGGWACRSGSAAGDTKGVEEQGVNTTDTTAKDSTFNLLDGVLDLDAWTSEPIEIDPRDTINIPPAVRAAAEGWYGGDLFLKYRGTMPDGIEVYGVAPAVTGLFVGWLPVFLWKEGRVVGIYGQGVSGKTLKKVERKPCTVTVPKKMTGRRSGGFGSRFLDWPTRGGRFGTSVGRRTEPGCMGLFRLGLREEKCRCMLCCGPKRILYGMLGT